MYFSTDIRPKKRYGDYQPRQKFNNNYNPEFGGPNMNHQQQPQFPFNPHHGMPKFDVPPFPGAQFNNGPRNNQRNYNGKPNPVKKDYNNEPYFHESAKVCLTTLIPFLIIANENFC